MTSASAPVQHRIFVVDPESVITFTLTAILRQYKYDAVGFVDQLVALQAVESTVCNLLIAEAVMVPFSGVQLAIKIRERHPACKVLLFSGDPAAANMVKTARRDGHYFALVAKPIQPNELLTRIGFELGLIF